jgi:hypothetical protein
MRRDPRAVSQNVPIHSAVDPRSKRPIRCFNSSVFQITFDVRRHSAGVEVQDISRDVQSFASCSITAFSGEYRPSCSKSFNQGGRTFRPSSRRGHSATAFGVNPAALRARTITCPNVLIVALLPPSSPHEAPASKPNLLVLRVLFDGPDPVRIFGIIRAFSGSLGTAILSPKIAQNL